MSRLRPLTFSGDYVLCSRGELDGVVRDVGLVARAFFNRVECEESVGAAERLTVDVEGWCAARVVGVLEDAGRGLGEGEIAARAGLDVDVVVEVLDGLGSRVAEVDPGVWMVVK